MPGGVRNYIGAPWLIPAGHSPHHRAEGRQRRLFTAERPCLPASVILLYFGDPDEYRASMAAATIRAGAALAAAVA